MVVCFAVRNRIRRLGARSIFTLVEMLVVIAIISILASLLMPTLQKTLKSSRGLFCQSNLRQNASAMHMYVNDNAGFFPNQYRQGTPDYTNQPQYWIAIYQNITTPKQSALWCPEDTRSGGARYNALSFPGYKNANGSSNLPTSYSTHQKASSARYGIFNNTATGKPFSMASCRQPSITMLMCEANGFWYKSMWDGDFIIMHNGAVNIGYVDGHAKPTETGLSDGSMDKLLWIFPQGVGAHPMWFRY